MKGSTALALSLMVAVAGVTVGADEDARPPSRRIAFAISGGASKGAYEAGLNWALVRAFSQADTFAAVLGGRHRTYEAASFAGASAGGINTLLSGLTWCMLPEDEGGPPNRIDDNIFRDVWLLPDVNSLLPPTPDSPHYLPEDALLARRDFVDAGQRLRELWGSPRFRPGCQIPLGVTLTRTEAEELQLGDIRVGNQRFYAPFVLEVQATGTAAFVLDPSELPAISDPAMILMPRAPEQSGYRIADGDVIELALTTSAFPGGFGRRRLSYCRPERYVPDGGADARAEGAPSLSCPEGFRPAEGVFADGGLFDNLPIGLARKLAEEPRSARSNPLPVSYVFLDPNRLRYDQPEPVEDRACDRPDPPPACGLLAYNLASESGMLVGALGTARTFELYRELTSGAWSGSLTGLAVQLGKALDALEPGTGCDDLLPYFDGDLPCGEAVRRAGELLVLAYERFEVPITPPYSAQRLRAAGVAASCSGSGHHGGYGDWVCTVDPEAYRSALARELGDVAMRFGLDRDDGLGQQVTESARSMENDRVLHITSRGAPITGTLLGSFGAFLDLEFREYDYYVGVYDAIVVFTETVCASHFQGDGQAREFGRCFDDLARAASEGLGVASSPRARFVFAVLARRNLAPRGLARFAYDPMPEADRSMAIIADGLERTLEAGRRPRDPAEHAISLEEEFFTTLRDQGFVPTPVRDGGEPLLGRIMEDPRFWSDTLVERASTRLVHLERQAKALYEAQEPDPARRRKASPGLMGAAAFALQSAAYVPPRFTFAPSTAPEQWGWRYVIPYEVAFDVGGNDLVLTWQPTFALDHRTTLGLRTSLGIAQGALTHDDTEEDDSYVSLGLDFSRRIRGRALSSVGITPAYSYSFDAATVERQGAVGLDLHAGFLKDRFRVGIGARDVNDPGDSWFLLVGITDLPGFVHWLTR